MSNAKGLRKGFDGRLLVIEDFETVKDALGRLQQFQRAALFGGGQVPIPSPRGGSVSYVSGTNCHPCVRPLRQLANRRMVQGSHLWRRCGTARGFPMLCEVFLCLISALVTARTARS
jgi:hypothetical protein